MDTQLPEWFKVGAEVFIGNDDRIIYEVTHIDRKKGCWTGEYQGDKAIYPLDEVSMIWHLYKRLYAITFGERNTDTLGYIDKGTGIPFVYYFTKEISSIAADYFKLRDYKLESKEFYQFCMEEEGKSGVKAINIDTMEKWGEVIENLNQLFKKQ